MNLLETILGSSSLEEKRYNTKANKLLKDSRSEKYKYDSINEIAEYLREPYETYLSAISENIQSNHIVLEVGCGTGKFSEILLKNSKEVYFLDISENSLKVIKERFIKFNNFKCIKGEMDNMPFKDNKFDFIVTSGSLSYSSKNKFFKEVVRVLKSNGGIICVDTLNNNPIYLLIRIINILLLKRSLITFYRIPNFFTLKLFKKYFQKINIKYFGSVSFLMPLLSFLIGSKKCKKLSTFADKKLKINFFSYKFVSICFKVIK